MIYFYAFSYHITKRKCSLDFRNPIFLHEIVSKLNYKKKIITNKKTNIWEAHIHGN